MVDQIRKKMMVKYNLDSGQGIVNDLIKSLFEYPDDIDVNEVMGYFIDEAAGKYMPVDIVRKIFVNMLVGKNWFIPDSEFDEKELTMGIEVELEHTNNPFIAKCIAKDHLAECPNYYTRLSKLEKDCKK